MWPGLGVDKSPSADETPPADRRSLTRSDTLGERGKPVVPPDYSGKRLVREADRAAGRGGGSKRMPFCNGMDRDCVPGHQFLQRNVMKRSCLASRNKIIPPRKRADFPLVLAYVKGGETDLRKQCRCRRECNTQAGAASDGSVVGAHEVTYRLSSQEGIRVPSRSFCDQTGSHGLLQGGRERSCSGGCI
jgi:hypothetical protein